MLLALLEAPFSTFYHSRQDLRPGIKCILKCGEQQLLPQTMYMPRSLFGNMTVISLLYDIQVLLLIICLASEEVTMYLYG